MLKTSFNCLRLDRNYVFQVEVYQNENDKDDNGNKNFFKINGDKYPFDIAKVEQVAKLITHKGKFEHKDILKLWKVDVDKSKINTEDDIRKNGGVSMEFEQSFVNYFPHVPDAKDVNIHIVAVIVTTSTGM
jgi:hypothetical protein